ncbi:hypothetical protein Ocin01_01741 [Orchesella cincta]|uniref:Centriolar coiled-coil protein n=1 Tax=Orchesella cincta TaxID=48709 RepID=A0A1D2NJ15_ORCCI|nr:hypothetical protein Ocin01_01741 [Orchesella cincta]
MDTTTSTIAMEDVFKNNYVSCIKVDGKPILPPIMTEERRQEMRRYKELAIMKEKELEEKMARAVRTTVSNKTSGETLVVVPEEEQVDSTSAASPRRSLSTSPIRGIPVTSTPRNDRIHSSSLINVANAQKCNEKVLNKETVSPNNVAVTSSSSIFDTSDVPEGVLRERKIIQQLDFNNSLSSAHSGSSAAFSYDGDEEKVVGSGSSDNGSGDNFASAASSTGTFVIRRSNARQLSQEDEIEKQDGATSDDDIENAPPTVLRKPSLEEPMFKRKRPAKYFDEEDDEKTKTTPKSSISISNLPNTVPNIESGGKPVSGTLKFSPVANTNFTAMAKSLTNEFTQKFAALLTSSSSTKSVAQSYDVILSKDIPSSAEERVDDSDNVSNSSDKENINSISKDESKKHVRKLSYTLATPSAVLLEAASKDKNFAQTLETVPSAPSSNVPSTYQSPDKPKEVESTIMSLHENVINSPKLDRVNMKLQELTLGQGKQAHLQRFLGDQELEEEVHVNENTDQVAVILKQMQKEHETKLQQLAEQHRLQELRLKQQFESELGKLKEKISSTLNTTGSTKSYKTSPNSLVESMNSSTRSPRPHTATSLTSLLLSEETASSSKILTSGMSGVSGFERTKSDGTSIYQFTGNSEMSTNSTYLIIGTADLAGVRLSKLQSRMQLMSPSLFRVPIDAKSPLLKGLVFPDPLDKPRPPIRIPPKAFDASMKPKFDRLSAAVKGYLTRRLLHTEKCQIIVQTIRDTVDLLLKLYEEAPMIGNKHTLKSQDANLHQMLIQQLTGACQSFHDIFFKLSIKERMAIIATDREKSRAKALRNLASPARRNISNATLKSLERRMSHRRTSPKKDNRKSRGPGQSNDPTPTYGSQSVKPKPVKIFNISPKRRRRISYWDEKNVIRRSTSATSLAAKSDLNGNNFKVPLDSARSHTSMASSARSTRSYYAPTTGTGSETFVVPSATPTGRNVLTSANNGNGSKSQSARRDSSTRSGTARSNQSTVAAFSASGRFRASSSRQQPWK